MTDRSTVSRTYQVLYTKHKTKKRKVWQDGVLKVIENNKAKLYNADEGVEGASQGPCIHSTFLKHRFGVGDEVDFERYLIQIEAEVSQEEANSQKQSPIHEGIVASPAKANQKPFVVKSSTFATDIKAERTVDDLIAIFSAPSDGATHTPKHDAKERIRALGIPGYENQFQKSENDKSNAKMQSRRRFMPPTSTALRQRHTGTELGSQVEPGNESHAGVQGLRFQRIGNERPTRKVRAKVIALQSVESYTNYVEQSVLEEIEIGIKQLSSRFLCGSQSGLIYDRECTIYRKISDTEKVKTQKKRKRLKTRHLPVDDEDDEIVDDNVLESDRLFLKSSMVGRMKTSSSTLGKNDLWLISKSPLEKANAESVWLMASQWYGSAGDGILEMAPISSNFEPRMISSKWKHQTKVHALLGPNIDQHLETLNLIKLISVENPPIMPFLTFHPNPETKTKIHPNVLAPTLHSERVDNIVDGMIKELEMNPDQSKVLWQVASWFGSKRLVEPPVILVHGVYGSGKTRCLVSIILAIDRLLSEISQDHERTKVRICVAAGTNVAVDRVLLGLEEHGFTRFARIGSVKKIHPAILKHTIHHSSKGLSHAVEEAKAQLRAKQGDSSSQFPNPTLSIIEQELRSLEGNPLSKIAREQAEKLNDSLVYGVTCCASSFEIMDAIFTDSVNITIIDECFQVAEALSLCPIVKARTSHLLLLGDPCQLPPVTNTATVASCPGFVSFEDSLYQRLTLCGYSSTMLHSQYRVHPAISNIASSLFYNGRVLNGITDNDRPSLLGEQNGPLLCMDICDSPEKRSMGQSFSNRGEQNVIVKLIRQLLGPRHGLEAHQIGVIALYRSQARELAAALQDTDVETSTVDAFQGQERDIIIVSATRTESVGFTDNKQRLNVLLTRAKNHFILVGNLQNLQRSSRWKTIIIACQPLRL